MNYLRKLFRTGAVRKTPQRIISRIAGEVSNETKPVIIEIGAGQGEITRALVKKTGSPNYFAFEIDAVFSETLRTNFPGINVLQQDARLFQLADGIPVTIDYFVSSIPLSFYKHDAIQGLCQQAEKHLSKDGKIIILFTAFWLIPVLRKALPEIQVKPFATLPPYFLAVYQKK